MSRIIGTLTRVATQTNSGIRIGRHRTGTGEELPKAEKSSTDATQALTLGDVNRVERLLAQLEARSVALVLHSQSPPPAVFNEALVVGIFISLWLSTVVAAVIFFHFTTYDSQIVEQIPVAVPRAVISASELREKRAAVPVDQLANALTASSHQVTQRKRATDHANRGLQRTMAKVISASAMPSKVTGEVRPVPPAALAPGSRPRFWDPLLDVKPTESATAHRTADGNIDYWVVPHGPFFSEPAKVLPIGRSPNGVYVRNLEDGRNYRLTPSGEWYILQITLDK